MRAVARPALRRDRVRLTPAVGLLALAGLLAGALPGTSLAADADAVRFDAPSADGALLEPLTYEVSLASPVQPVRVELVTRLPDDDIAFVQSTALRPDGDGRYRATLRDVSHIPPNSTFAYRFRAVLPDGSTAESAESTVTVADERFEWRSRSDGVVTLHWYEGDEAFADRALAIGSTAIEKAATLLGVEDMPEVDFFVYPDEDAFYDALGPGTRENVGGQANAEIRTMFGLITPSEVGSGWVDTLVSHELTHLVFNEAVKNPYHFPPRWLNEGLAVYLSQGYDTSDRATVSNAVGAGSIIPLEGLAGLFPTTRDRFSLAYAESVSAVDFLVRTYGEEALVRLITSYADGVTDDEAFQAALGMRMAAFDDAWMASIGASRPAPYGPQPAPPGPLPSGWSASPAP
jgi:hypothetical protein